ncbi:putative armadillo-like helical, nuclear condensin complex subunit 3 domain-containing protein [Helianthus annuus]|uniref:Armadillo-like helical, nuclear condensin complex subunit 3 domain-containing protein n=1 Tax=Helianthus annuus TaxID=4232 RepID=A0A9K3H8R3_HELAN|nr:condensin complex subunit 3-like [Helianthus annuus]KAF5769329.1 putative armadillo-like helical, nuclear condensin complex subunit 3 domain-containing protein [Helianthus annuus]
MAVEVPEENLLIQKIARVFDEAKSSRASHIRKLKDLSALRSSIQTAQFFSAFSKTLTPIFTTQRRFASVERIVQFVAVFACLRDPNHSEDCDAFFEQFLRFLVAGTGAANRTARFRACQIISEIIMRLPDDAEVSDELWDEVIDCIKVRVGDKVPIIRTFSVRALSRFANDAENSDILDLLLETLPLEQNPDVRKTILLSLPPSNVTSIAIINCTLDVSESVRKTAYAVLASKFPLQSLSIKQRTIILQRGLSDRSAAVTKECIKLMKDEWLMKSCNGDPVELLKYLDVETYESIGVSVMDALLKAGLVKLHSGLSIKQFISSDNNTTEGCSTQLMDAEVALYLRTLCKHLQTEAQAKGSDAAMTSGTEAAVYASEASDSNDLLEKILPESVSEYIALVKAHIVAGQTNRFTARQLLLLGSMLDFSDASNRKVAAVFVVELLNSPLQHEVDDDGNKVVIGDGISLGGEREWSDAVSGLAKKVHAAQGEFEQVVFSVVAELAQPCRERTADFLDWMHCLSVVGLLLEHTKSLRWMHGNSIEPAELLHSLLLPGAKHIHLDVQRAAVRCLGLFGLLERVPSEDLVKQLRLSFVKGPCLVSSMASKALMDLATWHGPLEVDKATNRNLSSQFKDHMKTIHPVDWSDTNEDLDIELIDLLYAGFGRSDFAQPVDADENESVHAVLAEGFAKILLLSENYPTVSVSSHPIRLSKLISLYFSSRTSELQRLKQCLSVFFEHYPSLSLNHKNCICKAFLPVMRSMWPGINGTTGGSNVVVSNMRKRAIQASRFMLQMLQAPLYPKEVDQNENNLPDQNDSGYGEEGLAICIAAEILSFQKKKNAAEKSYVSAICKILVSLRFKQTEQVAVKLMRRLMSRVAEAVSADKDALKELKQMSEHLKASDTSPDEPLQPEQANLLLGKLDVQMDIDGDESCLEVEPTPLPKSTRPVRGRRRARQEKESSSDEEDETCYNSVAPANPVMASVRSQRACKSAALSKLLSTTKPDKIVDDEDEVEDDDDGDESAVTSDDDSE